MYIVGICKVEGILGWSFACSTCWVPYPMIQSVNTHIFASKLCQSKELHMCCPFSPHMHFTFPHIFLTTCYITVMTDNISCLTHFPKGKTERKVDSLNIYCETLCHNKVYMKNCSLSPMYSIP